MRSLNGGIRILFIFILSVAFMIVTRGNTFAAVTSATLTPAPTTLLSNGKAYYCAGVPYTFRIQAVDPLATGKAYWNQIIVRFYEGATERASFTININAGVDTSSASGLVVDTIDSSGTTVWTNLDYEVTVRFRWDLATPYNAAATNRMSATVSEDGGSSATDTRTVNYGVCAEMAVLNFTQDGEASDGYVNPWHSVFNVTGSLVYHVTGESITTTIYSVDNTEITGTNLLLMTGAAVTDSTLSDGDMSDGLSYTANASYMRNIGGTDATPSALGNHTWKVRATTSTGSEDTTADVNFPDLPINCDKIQVSTLLVTGGGGADTSYYIRSVNQAGTRLRITATNQSGGGDMIGNTTFVVTYTGGGGGTFNVLINGNQNQGETDIPIPTVADGATTSIPYQITNVYGGAYDGDSGATDGQNAVGRINQPAAIQVYWDRNDPPGANTAPFTAFIGSPVATPTSLTLNWTPLTPAAPDYDGDFQTYRVYYRRNGIALWTMIDNTVGGFASLGVIGTGSCNITGLVDLNLYEYYITAVDLFGQEVLVNLPTSSNATYQGAPNANFYNTGTTTAIEIGVSVTDGIDSYTKPAYNGTLMPSATPLRTTAIKVSLYVLSSGTMPDAVNIIAATENATHTAADLLVSGSLQGSDGTDYYRIASTRTGPNSFTAYIPTTNPLISSGSIVRFLVEIVRGGYRAYMDYNTELEAPASVNPNDQEWTFTVGTAGYTPTFTPWPTRILNNVIDRSNPTAYPAYYLTEDAYVTIRVYDIKGRVVTTLLEDAYRKGGQNIKENGWSGTNKNRRQVGDGLYYIHIKAKGATSGREIINKMEKVVVAR